MRTLNCEEIGMRPGQFELDLKVADGFVRANVLIGETGTGRRPVAVINPCRLPSPEEVLAAAQELYTFTRKGGRWELGGNVAETVVGVRFPTEEEHDVLVLNDVLPLEWGTGAFEEMIHTHRTKVREMDQIFGLRQTC